MPDLATPLIQWYAENARDLPWRRPDFGAWGVLVSEFMLQQTPVNRVIPQLTAWLERWPTPAALAAEPPSQAVLQWANLGYPRRALRLHAAAVAMVERHGAEVPATPTELLALPGVGTYTAAAVSVFAFGRRVSVVDTNVRRVLARVVGGAAQAARSLTRAETDLATALLPDHAGVARTWSAAVMEVGALVCSARAPRCPDCPVQDLCAWQRAGRPAYEGPVRHGQPWHGTDRQCRGAILAVLRATREPVAACTVAAAWSTDDAQRNRCLNSLLADGLVEPLSHGRFRLPGRATTEPPDLRAT